MESYGKHYSVLKEEVLSFIKDAALQSSHKNIADLTFGAGGHTLAFADAIPHCQVFSCDQDHDAYKNGLSVIQQMNLEDRVHLYKTNFSRFCEMIPREVLFCGALLDAGVSSHQFDSEERGFSFRFDAPLDMRMNQEGGLTAYDVVNQYSQEDLEKILFDYGEERFAKTIVKNILKERQIKSIESTKELEAICFHSYPKKLRYDKIHPATKTFQALRIAVNDELGVLAEVIDQIIARLEIGGVFAVISFHSLEDRIVKRAFRSALSGGVPIEILTKRPIVPTEKEIFENSRSRSAKLRVIKRVEKWPQKNKYPRQ